MIVGLVSGMAAVLLKIAVHNLQYLFKQKDANLNWLSISPIIGILISAILIRYFFKSSLEKGIAMVLKAIAKGSSTIDKKHSFIHLLTSSVTVGLGGSAGLEAPIVATGSAIGANIGQASRSNYETKTLLIACGAAAGIAAVFNAPIAGLIFAVEVLLTDTIVTHFIPLIISSVAGVLVSKIFLHEASLFNFVLKQNFDYRNTLFYVALGVGCGIVSLYYARIFKTTEHWINGKKISWITKAIIGGLLLISIYYVFPPLFGEGYGSISKIATSSFDTIIDRTHLFSYLPGEWSIIIFSLLIVLLKPIAAGITIGSGGNGGNFAPSLFTGAFLGFASSNLINSSNWFKLPVGNFSLVAMAGVLSGVMYCPLTAIFLIAEITNGYELFIPLMIVSGISFFIVKTYEPFSMDIKSLAKVGDVFTHEKEKNLLAQINVRQLIQPEFVSIQENQNFKDLLELVRSTETSLIIVLNKNNEYRGIIELINLKEAILDPGNYINRPISTFMNRISPISIDTADGLLVIDYFDRIETWYLPVIDGERTCIGYISKAKLFSKYREILSTNKDIYDKA